MGFMKQWPKCRHEPAVWYPQTYTRGNDKQEAYAAGICVHCGRPLVAFPETFPKEQRALTRRHVAWWMLDKDLEHGGNTAVLPWSSECFAERMHRTVNQPLH